MTEPDIADRSDERTPWPPDAQMPAVPAPEPGDELEDEHPLEADYPDADDPDSAADDAD